MRKLAFLALAAIACLSSTVAMADKRVALVIGNSTYQHAPNLANPVNDAAAINLLLKSAGFDTVIAQDNLCVNDTRRHPDRRARADDSLDTTR